MEFFFYKHQVQLKIKKSEMYLKPLQFCHVIVPLLTNIVVYFCLPQIWPQKLVIAIKVR